MRDYTKTIWKDLIAETKEKLSAYPIQIDRIYDKYSSLRIEYHWTDKSTFSKKADAEIERIILDTEERSEILLFKEENKGKALKKESFSFERDKTFFGLTVYPYGVMENDIKKLPFYPFWNASSENITRSVFNEKSYINLQDWEKFCRSFIQG